MRNNRPHPGAGIIFNEPLIFDKSSKNRIGFSLETNDNEASDEIPIHYHRKALPSLPEVSENEVVRHFVRLSHHNYSIDTGMYPLGSCTMKYNPKVNEKVARLDGFQVHPYLPSQFLQGPLKLVYELEKSLMAISGFDHVSLLPAAGSQGEMTGVKIIRAALMKRDNNPRKKILIPESAHGTNPASCSLNGYQSQPIPANDYGVLSLETVAKYFDADCACIMITNPNTLGIFEPEIGNIAELVHSRGGFVYCDGANLNALLGVVQPGKVGMDVMQINLHKTFTTPHGGGGPGLGALGVCQKLEPFLPVPRIIQKKGSFEMSSAFPDSIGRVKSFFANFGMLIRAYSYILEMGSNGLAEVAQHAVLNANYIRAKLKDYYHLPYNTASLHEVIFNDAIQKKANGVTTKNIAKRLMDYGFHPPTVYFPLIVAGALMIEPTECESKEELDRFIEAMISISKESQDNPELVKSAPHNTYWKEFDEVAAARTPTLTYSQLIHQK